MAERFSGGHTSTADSARTGHVGGSRDGEPAAPVVLELERLAAGVVPEGAELDDDDGGGCSHTNA